MKKKYFFLTLTLLVVLRFSSYVSGYCQERYFLNNVDHGNFETSDLGKKSLKFNHRYFICNYNDHKDDTFDAVLFYTGNESPVDLYINNTGLMFRIQRNLHEKHNVNALIIFAEHRFYGKSFPVDKGDKDYFTKIEGLLSVEQAINDYVSLLKYLNVKSKPTIAFGGSYGGMLSAIIRAKFANIIHGAIAASAPMRMLEGINSNTRSIEMMRRRFWKIVTQDAIASDSNEKNMYSCQNSVRSGFKFLTNLLKNSTAADRTKAAKIFLLCDPNRVNLNKLPLFVAMAWDNMAMGNFPYESSYMTGQFGRPGVMLPPNPMRVACDRMMERDSENGWELLEGLNAAQAVFNNATNDISCNELPVDDSYGEDWDLLVCLENLPQESYFSFSGTDDMFFNRSITRDYLQTHCKKKFGYDFERNRHRAGIWLRDDFFPFDSYQKNFEPKASRIVFSNGDLDPWGAGAVAVNFTDKEIYSIEVKGGAHHLDLFFENEKDPQSVKDIRDFEEKTVITWIVQDLQRKSSSLNFRTEKS